LDARAFTNDPASPNALTSRQSKFKLSLAAYSYRELLTTKGNQPAAMDLHGFIDECAAMQLDGAELTGYYMPETPTPEYLHQLRAYCFHSGLSVSGTAIRSDFGWPNQAPERETQLQHVRRWVDYATELHAPMIRIFAGHAKKGVDEATTHRLMVTGIAEVCRYAGSKGIYLALENHGGPTETADGVLKLLEDVNSPWLRVNLDSGNFRGAKDPYAQFEQLVPYAVNVQIKVVITMPDGSKKPTEMSRLAEILKKGGYRGFVALEYEESGDVRAACRKHIFEMRKALTG
jgi:sugar phosphate isomerase/epimerase